MTWFIEVRRRKCCQTPSSLEPSIRTVGTSRPNSSLHSRGPALTVTCALCMRVWTRATPAGQLKQARHVSPEENATCAPF